MADASFQTQSLKDIGNVLQLRDAIDKEKRVTKYIRASLATVDILPVDYTLDLSVINKGGGNMAIAYDFNTPMEVYRKLCSHYNLEPYSGLRLWLTDDTQSYEEFSHHFDNNIIETAINSLSGKGRELRQVMQSFGNAGTLSDMLDNSRNIGEKAGSAIAGGVRAVADGFKAMTGIEAKLGPSFDNAVQQAAGTAAEVIFQGKQLSLPRIWKASDYVPTFNFNIKLVSPYGHKDAIQRFITEPILYILCMTAPRTKDGLSYGLFQPVKLKGYGIANINLGAITNVSIRRGGRETAYNVWKQPLIVEVALTVRPLCDGFAVMQPGCQDIATFSDANTPYVDNANESPAITTLGNVIQSFRPAPSSIVNQYASFAAVSEPSSAFNPGLAVGGGTDTNTFAATDASEMSA